MTRLFARVYRVWTLLLLVAVVAQLGTAGYGAFNAASHLDQARPLRSKTFADGFSVHSGLGYAILLGAVLLFLFALAGGLDRRDVLLALAAPFLVAIQIVLAWIGESDAWVGILHPLNALAILGLSGVLAQRARRMPDPAAS